MIASLAARLAAGAARLQAGLSVEECPAPAAPGTVAPFRSRSTGGVDATLAAADLEAAVPEPASWALLLAGGLVLLRRRRARSA